MLLQQVLEFVATADDRGRSLKDAPAQLRVWLRENGGWCVAALSGGFDELIVVVSRRAPQATCHECERPGNPDQPCAACGGIVS